jgi:hypothetical protein
MRLKGYDAVYAALALTYSLPLVTFDAELVKRCRAQAAGMRIFDASDAETELRRTLQTLAETL